MKLDSSTSQASLHFIEMNEESTNVIGETFCDSTRVNSKHLSTKSFIYYTYHDALLNFLIDPGAA